MNRNYGGVVWTNHALDMLSKRGIKQGDAYFTFKRPDNSRKGKAESSWIYYKSFKREKLEVVAKKNDKGEWLIVSVWSRRIKP